MKCSTPVKPHPPRAHPPPLRCAPSARKITLEYSRLGAVLKPSGRDLIVAVHPPGEYSNLISLEDPL